MASRSPSLSMQLQEAIPLGVAGVARLMFRIAPNTPNAFNLRSALALQDGHIEIIDMRHVRFDLERCWCSTSTSTTCIGARTSSRPSRKPSRNTVGAMNIYASACSPNRWRCASSAKRAYRAREPALCYARPGGYFPARGQSHGAGRRCSCACDLPRLRRTACPGSCPRRPAGP